MKISHVALWTKDIERLQEFYTKYFAAQCNALYRNEKKGFSSYFLKFDDGASLELMNNPAIPDNCNDPWQQNCGLIHIAFSVGTREKVDQLTRRLVEDGYTLISEPRTTGDGYYESCFFDPDNNRIEITV